MPYTAPTISASSLVFADLQDGGLDGYVQSLIAAQGSAPNDDAQTAVDELLEANKAFLPIERAKNIIDNWISGKPLVQATVFTQIADLQYAFLALATALGEIGTLVSTQSYSTHVGGTTTGSGVGYQYRTFP